MKWHWKHVWISSHTKCIQTAIQLPGWYVISHIWCLRISLQSFHNYLHQYWSRHQIINCVFFNLAVNLPSEMHIVPRLPNHYQWQRHTHCLVHKIITLHNTLSSSKWIWIIYLESGVCKSCWTLSSLLFFFNHCLSPMCRRSLRLANAVCMYLYESVQLRTDDI